MSDHIAAVVGWTAVATSRSSSAGSAPRIGKRVPEAVTERSTEVYERSRSTTSAAGEEAEPKMAEALDAPLSLTSCLAKVVSDAATSALHCVTILQYCVWLVISSART